MRKNLFFIALGLVFIQSCSNQGKNEFNYFYQNGNLQVSVARHDAGGLWKILFLHKMPSSLDLPIHPTLGDTLRNSMLIVSLTDEAGNLLAKKDTNVTSLSEPNEDYGGSYHRSLTSMKGRGTLNGYNQGREIRHAFFITPEANKKGWIKSKLKFEMYLYSIHEGMRPGAREVYTRVTTEKPWVSLEIPMHVKF